MANRETRAGRQIVLLRIILVVADELDSGRFQTLHVAGHDTDHSMILLQEQAYALWHQGCALPMLQERRLHSFQRQLHVE